MAPVEVNVCANEAEIITSLSKIIESKAAESIQQNNCFQVGLSGGSLIRFLCKALPSIQTSWPKWRLFFCDERLVPFDDPESTFGAYRRELLSRVPLQEEQFLLVDTNLPTEQAAQAYAMTLMMAFGPSLPRTDLLLLGMGPDGHTCSLFPGHPALKEEEKWVVGVCDSPKPPPCRVTLTLPLLNNARCVLFVTTGESKAEIIKDILQGGCEGHPPLPAAMVRPTDGELHWLIDKEAAKLLL